MSTADEFHEKWSRFIDGEDALDADVVNDFVTDLIIETVQGIEFLTVVEMLDETDLPDDAAEFVHDLITHPLTIEDIRKALP